jgi:y4mF family transcriptional regulator
MTKVVDTPPAKHVLVAERAVVLPVKLSKITTAVDIGRLVLNARQERALSQQHFADLAGVGRRFISELENGKPTLEFDKVLQVAGAIGIDLFAKER